MSQVTSKKKLHKGTGDKAISQPKALNRNYWRGQVPVIWRAHIDFCLWRLINCYGPRKVVKAEGGAGRDIIQHQPDNPTDL